MENLINRRVLFTGARSLFTLDLARRFHEQGYTVYAADTSHFHICRLSNSISKYFIVPSSRFQPREFLDKVVKIVEDEKVGTLIPSFEEIFCLALGRQRFPNSCFVFCSSYEILDSLHNKWRFNQKIVALGFPAPKSTLIQSQSDLNNSDLPLPYILKPCYSRAAQGILKVTTKHPPKIKIEPHNPLIAQEWLHGKRYCSYNIAHKGRLTTHVTYPLDCSIDDSYCINFRAIEHKEIQKWVESFTHKEQFSGQIAFDFIEVEGGHLYCVECNPRGTSGIHLYRRSDNLPEAFLNPNMPLMHPQPGSYKQIFLGMLFCGWKTALSNKTFLHFLKTLFTVPDIVFSFRDIYPFFFQPLLFCAYLLKSLKLKTNILTMFMHDIEWNGEDVVNLHKPKK